MKLNFASWRTTLCGALGAVGVYLVSLEDPWHTIGMVLSSVATFMLGATARDDKVTSESAGAKK